MRRGQRTVVTLKTSTLSQEKSRYSNRDKGIDNTNIRHRTSLASGGETKAKTTETRTDCATMTMMPTLAYTGKS